MIYFCERVENNVGNGENACYQHFLYFPQCFKSHLCQGHLWYKVKIVWCLRRFKQFFNYIAAASALIHVPGAHLTLSQTSPGVFAVKVF